MSTAETVDTTIASSPDVALTRKGEGYALRHERRRLRKEAAAEVERLLTFLDELDGDPDLEDTGDDEADEGAEFSLGWTSTINQASHKRFGEGNDIEAEHDGREPDENLELEPDLEPDDDIEGDDEPDQPEGTAREAASGHYPLGTLVGAVRTTDGMPRSGLPVSNLTNVDANVAWPDGSPVRWLIPK